MSENIHIGQHPHCFECHDYLTERIAKLDLNDLLLQVMPKEFEKAIALGWHNVIHYCGANWWSIRPPDGGAGTDFYVSKDSWEEDLAKFKYEVDSYT